jgi:acetoin utilization deacetylase AcuC-like enzyme
MTLVILEHLTPPGHPERPDRLRAIERVLEHEKFMFLLREQCSRADLEIIALCHLREYIEQIRTAVPQSGLVQLDDDTVLSAGSFEASLRAAGGAILALDEFMAGKAKNAFVAIRPAGHHAEAGTAMGFCLFNNAAIAVRHAQRRYGAERVAIVDFDAHHGNGSQQIFWHPQHYPRSRLSRRSCGTVVPIFRSILIAFPSRCDLQRCPRAQVGDSEPLSDLRLQQLEA